MILDASEAKWTSSLVNELRCSAGMEVSVTIFTASLTTCGGMGPSMGCCGGG